MRGIQLCAAPEGFGFGFSKGVNVDQFDLK